MPKAVNAPVLWVALLALVFARAASAEPWGPWSAGPAAPVVGSRDEVLRASSHGHASGEVAASVAATPFLWLLTFYQKGIGRVNPGRCPMYPTCSQYSVQAIHKHGPVVGIVMTADRLIHEIDEKEYVPRIRVGNRYRFDDPVSNNDFWWSGR